MGWSVCCVCVCVCVGGGGGGGRGGVRIISENPLLSRTYGASVGIITLSLLKSNFYI